ncbi:hypothetical protein SKAU_G00007960 [Synaphobranchus kaupii]|uniref:Uncharacterized protein n=1 Tax=Synaphobranchus kaupii TaxID=118154 RepID=A0A9Q1GAC0_SYNKA|nr:hypothetical protein SKAU_G00007960 [Synaphobranchus kaupii]
MQKRAQGRRRRERLEEESFYSLQLFGIANRKAERMTSAAVWSAGSESHANEPDNLPLNTEGLQPYLLLSFPLPRPEAQPCHSGVSSGCRKRRSRLHCRMPSSRTEINVRPRKEVFEERDGRAAIGGGAFEFGERSRGPVTVDITVSAPASMCVLRGNGCRMMYRAPFSTAALSGQKSLLGRRGSDYTKGLPQGVLRLTMNQGSALMSAPEGAVCLIWAPRRCIIGNQEATKPGQRS